MGDNCFGSGLWCGWFIVVVDVEFVWCGFYWNNSGV